MLAAAPVDGVIPLLVPASLVARTNGVTVGQTYPIAVDGLSYQVRLVAVRDTFPTMDPDAIFAVASRQQLKAVHPEALLAPSTIFVDAPDDALTPLTDAVLAATPAGLVTRLADVDQEFTNSPVTAAIVIGIAVAAIVAALYAALAVTAALALAGAARSTELAHLRMVGLSRRDAFRLAAVEHGPTVVLAALAGIGFGLGLFVLLEPGLGLDGWSARIRGPVRGRSGAGGHERRGGDRDRRRRGRVGGLGAAPRGSRRCAEAGHGMRLR